MNIDPLSICEYAEFACFILVTIFSVLLFLDWSYKCEQWMIRTQKPHYYRVWFTRCILIYLFVLTWFIQDFQLNFFTIFHASLVVLHTLFFNPWVVRNFEAKRIAEANKVDSSH